MLPCDKCLENNWKISGWRDWVFAVCQYCGHEKSFPKTKGYKKWKKIRQWKKLNG